jgi:hypothetical protein
VTSACKVHEIDKEEAAITGDDDCFQMSEGQVKKCRTEGTSSKDPLDSGALSGGRGWRRNL